MGNKHLPVKMHFQLSSAVDSTERALLPRYVTSATNTFPPHDIPSLGRTQASFISHHPYWPKWPHGGCEINDVSKG